MENPITPAPTKTPEAIELEMLATRESLTEKVVALENQVVGSVQTAADTITDTVQAVRSLVSETPGAVSDTVKQAAAAMSETMKETFDVSSHVRSNPWASIGVAAGVGFLAGALIGGRSASSPPQPAAGPPQPFAPPPPAAPSRPGMFDALFAMIGTKLKDLAETALESTTSSLKSNIQDGIPKLVTDAAHQLIDPHLSDLDAAGKPRAAHNGAHRTRV